MQSRSFCHLTLGGVKLKLSDTKPLKPLNLRDLPASQSGSTPPPTESQVPINKDFTPSSPLKQAEPAAPTTSSAEATVPLDAMLVGEGSNPAPPATPVEPCSHHECINGHTWAYVIAHSGCPGCKRGIFGLGFSNCPRCNEPPRRTRLRVDYSSERIGFTARCTGQHNAAETHYITIERPWVEGGGSAWKVPNDNTTAANDAGASSAQGENAQAAPSGQDLDILRDPRAADGSAFQFSDGEWVPVVPPGSTKTTPLESSS